MVALIFPGKITSLNKSNLVPVMVKILPGFMIVAMEVITGTLDTKIVNISADTT